MPGMKIQALAALALLTACGSGGDVVFGNGSYSVTPPALWIATQELHAEADLQLQHPLLDSYALGFVEYKMDFAEEIDLAGYADIIQGSMMQSLQDPQVLSEAAPIENTALPAVAFELYGIIENIKIQYYIVCMESAEHFLQLVLWTTPSRWNLVREGDFASLVASVKPVTASSGE